METIHSLKEMQVRALALKKQGKTIAFVPTMGYLHEGHLSLLREGRKRGDVLVLSIFVNPTQFGPGEDLDAYPRDLDRDSALASEAGTDLLFFPTSEQIYPAGYATSVDVEGLTDTLCGASRPGHFRGVTTVVAKLFGIVQPDLALFGSKDFQQLAVIRRMTEDLNLPVEIVGMPIVREEGGLAMSSRNVNLSAAERSQALCLVGAIAQASNAYGEGERRAEVLIALARQRIEQEPDARIDYLQICNDSTLADVELADNQSVMLLSVRVGKTRLIDNHYLSRPQRDIPFCRFKINTWLSCSG